jgi:hypothetical protein
MTIFRHEIAPSMDSNAGLFVVRGRLDGPALAEKYAGQTIANADDVIIATIPAGSLVLSGYYQITTGEGSSKTIDVGYSQNGTDNLSNLDVQTAASWTIMTDPNFASDDFDVRDAATDVYVNMDTAIGTAVVDFMWICVKQTDAMISGT